MVPEGCAVSDKCALCPLLDCYESYPAGGLGGMSYAIMAAWDAGRRHPAFLPNYRGAGSHIPYDVARPYPGITTMPRDKRIAYLAKKELTYAV